MSRSRRERLDRLLVERGLAETRRRAQALILAGQVLVNGERVDKPGKSVDVDAALDVKDLGLRYVGRGGLKLEGALHAFNLSVAGLVSVDVGASTGGFTDCLLQHGAACVYAVDVGRGQLHWKLRNDPRVIVREDINARYLKPEEFPLRFDVATIDVSFISLTKVLPTVLQVMKPGGVILALVKPQFEVGKGEVGKGGIVRDPVKHQQVLSSIQTFVQAELGLQVGGIVESIIAGAEGNKEFFMLLTAHS